MAPLLFGAALYLADGVWRVGGVLGLKQIRPAAGARTTENAAELTGETEAAHPDFARVGHPDGVASVSRRVLCVFPKYAKAFGTFHHAYPLLGVKGFMPPQGLLVIAAYLPAHWEVRFVDENIAAAKDSDYRWADAVFCSGMHIQRDAINEVNRRAHAFGKVTVLGGPSVSGAPEFYPEFDYLHVGELGDATDAIVARLAQSVERPRVQQQVVTAERLPMAEFPTPAYKLAGMDQYFLANVQFSSGCPYKCEFCDIPELYGNNPRLKTPAQVIKELDEIVAGGCVGAVYFVDDNFVGNRKAAKGVTAASGGVAEEE